MTDRDMIERWVRPALQGSQPYAVPDATGMVKLDAMENPYTWPEAMRRAWAEGMMALDVNRYPDPQAHGLKARLRQNMALPAEMELLLGNGSDELILLLNLALGGEGRVMLSVGPSFAMYRLIGLMSGWRYQEVPLTEDFELDREAMLAALDAHKPALTYIAYPNNPTGNRFDAEVIREIIRRADSVVVIDEAYYAFASHSFKDEVLDYPNVILLRTVSKMGLAGLRLGVLAASKAWVETLETCRLPYNINVLTQYTANFALDHGDVFAEQIGHLLDERKRLAEALSQMTGVVRCFPSEANFLTFRTETDAVRVFEGLVERGVLIKKLHGGHPLLRNCLRVTVGKPEENRRFLEALETSLGG